jgi:hypothetical protein
MPPLDQQGGNAISGTLALHTSLFLSVKAKVGFFIEKKPNYFYLYGHLQEKEFAL